MATSGVIGASSTSRPYLQIWWDIDDEHIPTNSTRVRARVYLYSPGPISFSAKKSGSLEGTEFSYTGGMRSSGYVLVRTQYFWVYHDSAGNGSKKLSAWFDVNITYSGSWVGRLSASGTATLPKRALKSSFNSVSFSETIKYNGGGRINLGVTGVPSGYYQWVGIYDGSTIVHDWGYSTATPTWWSITSTIARKILNRIPNSKTKDFTVRVYTYTGNGTGNLGYESRTVTATVDSGEGPKITSTSASVYGSGWDKTNGYYLQNISKVSASFASSAPYGASINSQSITIDGKTHKGASATSATLTRVGSNAIKYEVVDSRGFSASTPASITVTRYTSPTINKFTTDRRSSAQTSVDVAYSGSFTSLGGVNKAQVKLERKRDGYAYSNVAGGLTNVATNTFSNTATSTGVIETASYEYRLTVTDSVGNSTTSTRSVSTAMVLMNLNKNLGIGIGKMHQSGILDISGEVHLDDRMHVAGRTYLDGGVNIKGGAWVDMEKVWTDGNVLSGSNSNGSWVRYPDGTQICYQSNTASGTFVAWSTWNYLYFTDKVWTFPKAFYKAPAIHHTSNSLAMTFAHEGATGTSVGGMQAYRPTSGTTSGVTIQSVAIGRWKA